MFLLFSNGGLNAHGNKISFRYRLDDFQEIWPNPAQRYQRCRRFENVNGRMTTWTVCDPNSSPGAFG